MKKVFICLAVTVCYWIVLFIGPGLVMLWNNLSYALTGSGYRVGSIMHGVMSFLSQPIACFLAMGAANAVGGHKHNVCTFVNCIVSACFFAMIGMLFIVTGSSDLTWQMVISAAASVITAVIQFSDMKEQEPVKNKAE